MNGYEVLVGF